MTLNYPIIQKLFSIQNEDINLTNFTSFQQFSAIFIYILKRETKDIECEGRLFNAKDAFYTILAM